MGVLINHKLNTDNAEGKMFTGIVEEIGRTKSIARKGLHTRLTIEGPKIASGVRIGDSVCVSGVCLTVVRVEGGLLWFDVMTTTLRATTLKFLRGGAGVNVEQALKVGDRLGGHFVTGHVDAVGRIRARRILRGSVSLRISVHPKFLKFLYPKGSVAVDGVSLTVADVRGGCFSVSIIPHTAQTSTLGSLRTGNPVNVEFDLLVKKG